MFTENTAQPYCVWEHKCFKYLALHNSSSCALCVHMSAYAFLCGLLEEKVFSRHHDCGFCFQVDNACGRGDHEILR